MVTGDHPLTAEAIARKVRSHQLSYLVDTLTRLLSHCVLAV